MGITNLTKHTQMDIVKIKVQDGKVIGFADNSEFTGDLYGTRTSDGYERKYQVFKITGVPQTCSKERVLEMFKRVTIIAPHKQNYTYIFSQLFPKA